MSCGVPKSPPREEASKSQNLDSPGSGDPESGTWLWDWSRYTVKTHLQDEEFEVATIECWKYEEDEGTREKAPTIRYKVGNFHTEFIDSWLKEPYPFRNGQLPSSGFKIMVMPCDRSEVFPPITKGRIHSINTAFGLPQFQNHSASLNPGTCGMFLQSDSSYAFILRKTTDFASISAILRYDPQTNATRGVFYIHLNNISFHCFEKMPAQFIKCSHPLLLPLLAVELTFETKVRQLYEAQRDLEEIEKKTGYSTNIAEDEWTPPSDYRPLVRRLGQGQSQLHLALATISTARFSAEFIRQKLRHLNKVLSEECQGKLKISSQLLDERVEFLLTSIEHAYLYNNIKERMQSQQTVLFNLIAQSDNLVNISLAKDSREIAVASKQDSSAMKIIAMLTTFFLPGTFMAPSISQVTTSHFWIYWAVTGPLTLAIMAGVIAWALWHNRHVQLLQSRARENIGTEITRGERQEINERREPGREKKTVRISTSERAIHNKYSLIHILKRRHHHSDSATTEP